MGHQFVEHLRAFRQLFVVLAVLIQQSDGLTIAPLGIGKFFAFPIQVTQRQQQHTLFYTVTRGLLVALLVGFDGLRGVALTQPDVADSVIHLIQIVLVVVRCCHAFQFPNHLAGIALSHHLSLGDTGIKLHLVGRIQAHHMTESIVSLLTVSQQGMYLSIQEPLAGLLLAAFLVFDNLAQIRQSLLVAFTADVVVGIGVVPILHSPVVHRVTTLLGDDILGIVQPVQLHITLGQPCTGNAMNSGLRLVQAAHIRERCCGLFELP